MKQATIAQKELMKKIDLDKLEDMHEDMREMMEDQEEIQEVLGRDYGVGGYDESELEAELGELDEEIVNEKMEGEAAPSYLPQKAQVAAKSDKDELNNIMNN